MVLPPKTIESMEQIAEKLESWANDRKRHRMLCKGLPGLGCRSSLSEPLRGFSTTLLRLKCKYPDAAKDIEKEHSRVLSIAREIDEKIKQKQPIPAFEASALQLSSHLLAKKLRTIAESTKADMLSEKPGGKQEDTTPVSSGQLYVELNLAERLLVIGTDEFLISSARVWDFLKTLAHNKKTGRITPRMDGDDDWKNAVDTLRRKIGKDRLHEVVHFSRDGYFLAASVKVAYGSQVGIRKTRGKLK